MRLVDRINFKKIEYVSLNRKLALVFEEEQDQKIDEKYVIGLNELLRPIGFVLSPELSKKLTNVSLDSFALYALALTEDLNEIIGNDVKHKPMYQNFPTSVVEATDMELEIDRIAGYYLDFLGWVFSDDENKIDLREKILFDGPKKERVKLKDNIEYRVINDISFEEFCNMFKDLMNMRSALSESDRNDLEWFLSRFEEAKDYIPATIPFKETLILVVNITMERGWDVTSLPLKTATDVLRLAVAWSDGDVSLATTTKFKHFKTSQKRVLLTALNMISQDSLVEDVVRRKEVFKRLSYALDYDSKRNRVRYSHFFDVMEMIYGRKPKVFTWRTKVAFALGENNVLEAAKLLAERPGEFARALDKVLREAVALDDKTADAVLDRFKLIACEIPTTLLWDLRSHFVYRNKDKERIAFPKGISTDAILVESDYKNIPESYIKQVIAIIDDAIDKLYAKKDPMGYVYLDESLKDYLMPSNNRSASRNLGGITKGSRLKLKEGCDFVRAFIYWVGRDVDLSADVMDDGFRRIDRVAYFAMRMSDGMAYHSGDITNAPNGASEFIDVNMPKIKEHYPNAKYVAFSVNSYTGIPYDEMERCFAGVMEREDLNSGEIFEPATVKVKSDLTSHSTIALICLVDIDNREIIWVDTPSNYAVKRFMVNNIETAFSNTQLVCKYIVNLHKPSIYDVVLRNTKARKGKMVHSEVVIDPETQKEVLKYYDDANKEIPEDKIQFFSLDKGITPKDTEKLVSQYL